MKKRLLLFSVMMSFLLAGCDGSSILSGFSHLLTGVTPEEEQQAQDEQNRQINEMALKSIQQQQMKQATGNASTSVGAPTQPLSTDSSVTQPQGLSAEEQDRINLAVINTLAAVEKCAAKDQIGQVWQNPIEKPSAENNYRGCEYKHWHGHVCKIEDPDPNGCGWGINPPIAPSANDNDYNSQWGDIKDKRRVIDYK